MEDFVRPTGRTRYATKIIHEGKWWRRQPSVILVLQIEEFYHEIIRGEIDRSGHADPDRVNQGYCWRDATLEDLATMGDRKYEPTVEDVRRHTRSYGSRPTQPMGTRPAVNPDPGSDGWPSILRGYPDVAPAGFQEATVAPSRRDAGTQSGTQPPPAPGAAY